jgi:hypothetical protein
LIAKFFFLGLLITSCFFYLCIFLFLRRSI